PSALGVTSWMPAIWTQPFDISGNPLDADYSASVEFLALNFPDHGVCSVVRLLLNGRGKCLGLVVARHQSLNFEIAEPVLTLKAFSARNGVEFSCRQLTAVMDGFCVHVPLLFG